MMNIKQISIEQLYAHPENPRLQLGDLTELADSIKKNGVMQNLTVVPGHFMSKEEWTKEARAEGADKVSAEGSYRLADAYVGDGYTVIIGHRRLAAAKMAGLAELPCVISEMDHREQIATMLEENMQRADLTVFEQAQGFQMMMNLGFSAKEISEKTGFGETTVRRRLKMAEMDPKLLKKACETKSDERQITLFDFERLAQVDSIKERNKLLKEIGDRNFDWNVKRALKMQRAKAVRKDALKELRDAGIKELKGNEEYSSRYERLWNENVDLGEWKPGEKLIPKTKEQLFFFMTDDGVKFYIKAKPAEKPAPAKKTEAQKKKEAAIENAWKIADRITQTSAEMRTEFVNGLTVKPSNAMQMLRWAIIAALSDAINHKYDLYTKLTKCLDIQGQYSWEKIDNLEKTIMEMPQSEWPNLIMILLEGVHEKPKDLESFASGYRGDWPRWTRNTRLEQCYKWLTEFGYTMSTEEIEMMSGTHAVFQTKMGGTGKDESAGADD